MTACSLDIPPADQYSDPDAISEVGNARSLLASAYLTYPHLEYELSLLGADFCPTSLAARDITMRNLYYWQDNSITDFAQTAWEGYYSTIAACDALLDRIEYVKTSDESEWQEKQHILNEAITLKSMCYFQLLRLFAPAYEGNEFSDGIILTECLGLKFNRRSSIAVCTDTIRNMLTRAASTDYYPQRNGWLGSRAAQYLLAELELYAGRYAEASSWAEQVLAGCDEAMFSRQGIGRLWETASCNERIFAFFTDQTYYSAIEYSEADGDYFMLNPSISYELDDVRREFYTVSHEMGGQSRCLLGKYNKVNKEGRSTQYINTIRYAGAYFIAAEAYARQPGMQSKAITTLNHFLDRVGGTQLSADDMQDENTLIEAILDEKLKEFAGEGVCYFDLKRNCKAALPRLENWGVSTSANIRTDDYRWTFPIPQSEYRYNENVTQNKGWPLNRQ